MAIYKNVEPLETVSWTATKHHDYDEGFADVCRRRFRLLPELRRAYAAR